MLREVKALAQSHTASKWLSPYPLAPTVRYCSTRGRWLPSPIPLPIVWPQFSFRDWPCLQVGPPSVQSVQLLSHVRLLVTPWIAAHQASLSITNSRSLLKPMSIESVIPSNHLILCHPLLLLPSIFPQHQGLFQWVRSLHQVAKVLEFQLSISPSNEYSGLVSFRMDWLDFVAVQETLKSLLQHHSSKVSIFRCPAFFIVQLSHPYMTSEGRQNENHSHRKLTNLITWTTALSNSMKLWAMLCKATEHGRVMVESSDKTWSTGKGNGKPLQYSCLGNPMNSMKRAPLS